MPDTGLSPGNREANEIYQGTAHMGLTVGEQVRTEMIKQWKNIYCSPCCFGGENRVLHERLYGKGSLNGVRKASGW